MPTRRRKAAQTGGERAPQFTPAVTTRDDLDNDMPALINDMLADMCGLIVKTIALIPPERDAERLSACAFVLEEINEGVERMVNADPTQH